jgi:anti-sigma-K factor RskA
VNAEPYTCADVSERVDELALGTLPGDERELVLAHLEGCPSCQDRLADAERTVDALLLALPSAPPPEGFSANVSRRITRLPDTQRPTVALRRRRWPVLAVAAVLVVALGLGGVLFLTRSTTRTKSAEPNLVTAALVTGAGDRIGTVTTFGTTEERWVYMSVARGTGDATYTCVLVLRDGTRRVLGKLMTHNGRGEWGTTISIARADLAGARLEKSDGTPVAGARLS